MKLILYRTSEHYGPVDTEQVSVSPITYILREISNLHPTCCIHAEWSRMARQFYTDMQRQFRLGLLYHCFCSLDFTSYKICNITQYNKYRSINTQIHNYQCTNQKYCKILSSTSLPQGCYLGYIAKDRDKAALGINNQISHNWCTKFRGASVKKLVMQYAL